MISEQNALAVMPKYWPVGGYLKSSSSSSLVLRQTLSEAWKKPLTTVGQSSKTKDISSDTQTAW